MKHRLPILREVKEVTASQEESSKLVKILIPAVGGQGGGVLTEWLVQAFLIEGFEVQGIGLPGLSQRGGSTTYYIEAHPPLPDGSRKVIFSQYPVPGDVDVILSQEFLELGRLLEAGFGSEKTTIVTSTHRVYSTLEKMPSSGGVFPSEKLKRLAVKFSKEFIGFDALQLAKSCGMDELAINAILLGALAATGALPINEASFLKAIEGVGVSVATNIKAWRRGWDFVRAKRYEEEERKAKQSWEAFVGERASKLQGRDREAYRELLSEALNKYPIHMKEILAEALFRLIDYQGVWYARRYLEDLDEVYELDIEHGEGYRLTESFAKNYALWRTYEDGIRVAELKIRSERFKKIREDIRLSSEQVYRVIDYLKPDAYEIYGLLPYVFVAPFVRLFNLKPLRRLLGGGKPVTFAQKPVTNSFLGFLRLWLLTKLKWLRPLSYRYKIESRLMDKYKRAVLKYGKTNYELGVIVARSGSLIKGYGKVRRRTIDAFERFIANVIAPLADLGSRSDEAQAPVLRAASDALALVSRSSIDGIKLAEAKVKDILRGKAA